MSEESSNSSQNNVTMNIEDNKESQIQPPENITIPFVLLTNLHNILVAAGDRGAFKTAEMYDIGRVYNEVKGYLVQHLKSEDASNQPENKEVIQASELPEPEFALNEESKDN